MIVKLKVSSMISLGENKMKQPLKEMLKKIGGRHLLIENADVDDYSQELGEYLHHIRIPPVKGWTFTIDINSGAWMWDHVPGKFEDSIYATWGWMGKQEIAIEVGDGDFNAGPLKSRKIKLKFKGLDGFDEKQMKIDAKKYIDAMKKEIPKIQKKMLEY